MTTTAHLNNSGAPRRSGSTKARMLVSTAAALVAVALLPSTGLAYSWPVKPFDQAHPVRGSFGDPRTLFAAPPTLVGLYHGNGSFSFHQGVDVSAPDGTAVYPVESGVVVNVTFDFVRVASGTARFEYWHLNASVRVGEHVKAQHTVLGRIKRGAGHVHLTEIDSGRVTDPLLPGHLTPYSDTTTPVVSSIRFRPSDDGPELMTGFMRGRIEMIAEAYDTPALPVPGQWNGLPVTPALVTWRIESWNGKIVVPETVARDARTTVPPNTSFWSIYARGTYQNMAVFGKHFSWLQPGCYLFRLTPQPFDTRRLKDGVYQLVVTVADVAGNHSSLSQRFAVHNAPGYVGV
jgi:hypothetical protein